jgi:hypothetical protein
MKSSMKKYSFVKPLFLSLFLIAAYSHLFAQHLDSLLNELDTKYPQEKVYLQLDRSYYNPGETIWFKAYLTSDNLPSTISKTLYAELLDAKGNLLQRKTLPVLQSSAALNFDLPDTINSSLLYVRAYTSWMLNFDSSMLFIKPIHIIKASGTSKKNTVISYSLHFFPEGGDLIAGIKSRLAFKANDQYGKPVDASGIVLDDKNNKIASFSSIHDGMGYFLFMPLADTKYKAQWKDKKGVMHETDLPDAKKQGVVLNIDNIENQVTYTLTRPDNADNVFTFYYVVAQIQQQVVYSAKINMSKKTTISTSIPTDSLPDGIMQVTVFNASQVPVAERIVFINRDNYYFNTDLHAVDKHLDKRGHNALQVDVGGNLLSNLSISVTDADLNPPSDNEENIFSSLLLSSDLKGYIYNPAYYFSSDDDSVKRHLDLVMMTNGWRRFNWQNLVNGQWPVIKYEPENYLSIKGKVFGLSQSLLVNKEISCILKTKNATAQIFTIPVTKDGAFKRSSLYFFDTAKVYYQFNNDKDKSITSMASFSIYSSFINSPQQPLALFNSFNAPVVPDSSTMQKNIAAMNLLRQSILDGYKIKVLDVVTVTARQKTPEEKMDEKYTSGFFSGTDAHIFILDTDPFAKGALNVINYLQGKVAGLQISMDGSGNSSATWRGGTPSIFLDEMQSDLQTVQSISMSDVAMVKVFPPPFMGGPGGSPGGAIAIYTKKGGDQDYSLVKGLDFSTIIGYSAIKEFYSPDYATKNDPTVGDYRTTLYWNPFIIMDKTTRRVTIPFYNNDKCKKIRVVIEGMNELGQLTREEKIFE